jgi:DNA repair and recombination protein RAD52
MAGAFSGHLIDSYLASKMATGPFGGSSQPHNVAISGPISFQPNMHGSPMFPGASQASTSSTVYDPAMAIFDMSKETQQKLATLQVKLNQRLGPEYLSQRPGPGGGPKLTYVEGWKVINLANEVFGFNGWSSSVINMTTDFMDTNEQTGRYSVGVTAIVRVTLRDGVYHEDVGYGILENSKSKGQALDKVRFHGQTIVSI